MTCLQHFKKEVVLAAIRKSVSAKATESERARDLRRQLGRVLKSWREDNGLTQADLAQSLGLKYYSFVSQVENGLGRIPQDLYAPWAEALGVDLETFCWCVLAHVEPSLYDALAKYDTTSEDGWRQ